MVWSNGECADREETAESAASSPLVGYVLLSLLQRPATVLHHSWYNSASFTLDNINPWHGSIPDINYSHWIKQFPHIILIEKTLRLLCKADMAAQGDDVDIDNGCRRLEGWKLDGACSWRNQQISSKIHKQHYNPIIDGIHASRNPLVSGKGQNWRIAVYTNGKASENWLVAHDLISEITGIIKGGRNSFEHGVSFCR